VRVTVVVPCYNEEKRLDVAAFRGFGDADFLFVNDGSTDGTLELLRESNLNVLNLERNSGKAEAVRRGIVKAIDDGADIVGFWDADLATPLNELPAFVEILDTRPNVQMVMGARVRLLGRDISRQASRHYFGRMGATLISQTLQLAVYDTQCGAKLFRATDDTRHVFSTPFISRWIFDVEVIARYVRLWGRDLAARSIVEVPVRQWHDVKGSKLKSNDFARALRDLWRIRRAYKMKGT